VPSAVADPEEMRSFAADLKRFNTEVQADLASIRRRLGKLGETWKDQEHAKFADVFGRMLATYVRLSEASEKHIPLLMRKAQKIQDYLGPHVGSTGRNAAEIASPDLIKEFRVSFLKF
jgi:WXG100 family type VII secretion target